MWGYLPPINQAVILIMSRNTLPTLFVPHGVMILPLDDVPARTFLHGLGSRYTGIKAVLYASAHWNTEIPTVNTASLTGDHPRLLRVSSGSFSDRAEYTIIYANPANVLPSVSQRYHPRTGSGSARSSGATQVSVLPSYPADGQ